MTDQLPQKAGEKRPNNHEHYEEENGGTPKKQKVDLEDGPRRMIKEPEPFAIESTISDGCLLTAKYKRDSIKLEVVFNSLDFDDPSTVFQIVQDDKREANFLSYSKNDEKFYLAVKKDSEVQLRKLLHPPETDKYFFYIKKINRKSDSPVTFKSYKSGEYLHCKSDNRRVVMEKARGNKQPRDRETWFKLLPRRQQPQEQLIQIQQDQLDGMENTCEGFLILENNDSEDEDPELSVNNEDPNEGTHFEKHADDG